MKLQNWKIAMVNFKIIISGFLLVILTGCYPVKKTAYTAGGGILGGGLSYALFDGNPLATGIGAVGGAILGSFCCGENEQALAVSYNEGYVKARSDAIKSHYWIKQAMENSNRIDCRLTYYTFPADKDMPDGRMLVDHTVTVPILE